MPNLSSLANIPGYGAYIARREMNEGQELKDIQQAGALLQLKNAIQGQQQEQQLRSSLAQSGGDVEAAMQAALRAGRADVAAKLATIVEARRRATAPRVVGPGSQVLGPNNEVVHQVPFAPQKPETAPNEVRLVEFYNNLPETDPRKPLLKQFIDAKTRVPDKAEKTYPIVHTAEGIFERRPEGLVPLTDPKTGQKLNPTVRERPITEYQGKNAMFGARAQASHKTLLDLEDKINVTGLAVKRSVQDMPVIGGVLGAAANVALSKEQQQVEQAQRNFVNAVLRQESGAVINPSEFENAIKQYFPQPGDKKEVIEQKRKNRMTVIEGFKKIAGSAWSDEAKIADPQDILNQADEIIRGKP